MRRPSQAGRPVNAARVRAWVRDFKGFTRAATEERIDRWLAQFKDGDRDLAARTLDAVEYFGPEDIANAYQGVLGSLPNWHVQPGKRSGRWLFVALSSSAGESGDEMLRRFRNANGMRTARFASLFGYRSDLLAADLGPRDSVVFVDDFSGTGDQVCSYWTALDELLPGRPNTYLALIAVTKSAKQRIEAETSLEVLAHRTVDDRHNFFLEACTHFSGKDKESLLSYCRKADRKHPKGYGDCGLTLVFAHSCPNNSLPVLHAWNDDWEGLFARHE